MNYIINIILKIDVIWLNFINEFTSDQLKSLLSDNLIAKHATYIYFDTKIILKLIQYSNNYKYFLPIKNKNI